MIEDSMLRELYDHLKPTKGQNVDLFLYSRGGASVVAWGLVNLIREYAKRFCVIIPYKAHSCATAMAIGADKIVMGRLAELGPVDPTIATVKKGERLDVSVEDMSGYINFLKNKFEIKAEDQSIKAFEKLADEASPLTLGRAYREYIKAREDTKKLLSSSGPGCLDHFLLLF
jgi:ClpP class serine protease